MVHSSFIKVKKAFKALPDQQEFLKNLPNYEEARQIKASGKLIDIMKALSLLS
ncbi:MAG: hypothetical protein HC799_02275 [Limnothrix sp. RL_2_0]|nr:hypothetical protein [Limnothrix sp. RL_2_0]